MSEYAFPPAPVPTLPILGSATLYPVRRIFCVGRNYAAHAAEMGTEVDREAPWYFLKSPHALARSGATLAYPPGTADYQHEIELVVALGPAPGGAGPTVWGYAAGLDMTRRDLQAEAKEKRRPWDLSKDFEESAVISPLTPAIDLDLEGAAIRLTVNGAVRQEAPLTDMVWDVPAILSHLAGYYTLGAGDLVMTGTPAGVGPVGPGDTLEGTIDGLEPVRLQIAR